MTTARMAVPENAHVLRRNVEVTTVWLDEVHGRVFKQQPKHLTDNEYHFLKVMEDTGYVPINVIQEDIETISMEVVIKENVTDPLGFMRHYKPILDALERKGIRHGDLTDYAIITHDNKPIIIDFAESRWIKDPVVGKRPQPDSELLLKAMRSICEVSLVINTRSPKMWQYISSHIDFTDKTVIDLGCGYGDLALFASAAGAASVLAVDSDPVIAKKLERRVRAAGFRSTVTVIAADIEEFLPVALKRWDVAIMTSVLPYLKNMNKAMYHMSYIAEVSIIEAQYAGDGPGLEYIENDGDMKKYLEHFWDRVEKVGETKLDIRPATRSIWVCRQ